LSWTGNLLQWNTLSLLVAVLVAEILAVAAGLEDTGPTYLANRLEAGRQRNQVLALEFLRPIN
jgi:hypothetical protein